MADTTSAAVMAPTTCCGCPPVFSPVGPHVALVCGGCGTNVGRERLSLPGHWVPKRMAHRLRHFVDQRPAIDRGDGRPCTCCGRRPSTLTNLVGDGICAVCGGGGR